jgi:hypothetical protein
MSLYHTTDARGVSEICPPPDRLRALVRSLDKIVEDEVEHPDISLVHDGSGWSLSLFPGGVVVWENLGAEDSGPRFLRDVPRGKAAELWLKLARGEIEAVEEEPWETG